MTNSKSINSSVSKLQSEEEKMQPILQKAYSENKDRFYVYAPETEGKCDQVNRGA